MNILDWQKERRLKGDLTESEESLQEAIKMFDQQKETIRELTRSEGMKHVLNYWKERKNACERFFLSDATSHELMLKTRGRYEEATKFLQYLDNMVKD